MKIKMVPKPIPYDRSFSNNEELICNISTVRHAPIQMMPPINYHTNNKMDLQSLKETTPDRNTDPNQMNIDFFSHQIMNRDFDSNPMVSKFYPTKKIQRPHPKYANNNNNVKQHKQHSTTKNTTTHHGMTKGGNS
jgi:hypothetical protein